MNTAEIVSLIILIAFTGIGLFYLGFIAFHLTKRWDGPVAQTIRDNGASALGLPFAGLSAFVIVLLLKLNTEGELKFEGLSMNLTGPSSQLMFGSSAF
jgi:hypothetical protein